MNERTGADGLGYSIVEGVVSDAACDALASALAASDSARGRAGTRHLMSTPEVQRLANDDRLVSIAAGVLDGRAVPYRATLFERSGRANWHVVWHQDTALPLVARVDSAEWGPWSTKAGALYAHAPARALERVVALRVHLDASTADNGPLRVLPGSHALGVLDDDDVFALARRTQPVDCLVGKGGVLVMRPLLIHSSCKARVDLPRRVVHVEYADDLDVGSSERLAVA